MPTNDPLAALTPSQRLAMSAALTAAFVAEIEELAKQSRAILAERERLAAESQLEPEEAATSVAA